jgi:hypothetical protein
VLNVPTRAAADATVAVLLVADAIAVAAELVAVPPGLAAAGILLATIIVFTMDLRNIRRFNFGAEGFSLETHLVDARAAVAAAPPEEDGELSTPVATGDGRLTQLRFRLEAKLSYIAGHMNVESGAVMIGSLLYDGYLTNEEAVTADVVLRTSEEEFARASRRDREQFLDAGERVVSNIRASVLAGAVHKQLIRSGWDVERAEGGKRDLLATSGARRVLVVPVFSLATEPKLPAKIARRIKEIKNVDRRVIVLPDAAKAASTPRGEPAIVRLAELQSVLDATA